jgi:hypothetical protein
MFSYIYFLFSKRIKRIKRIKSKEDWNEGTAKLC